MDILLPRFRERLTHLLPHIHGKTIFSAFSGGKDSVTLLTLLAALEQELGFTLKAAYLNHGIRSDTAEESRWVANFCERRDIPLIIEGADVPGFAANRGLNLEAAASYLRYDFLNRLTNDSPLTWAATGHTLSDQVETFFMRLFRGSGAAGLASIRSRRALRILRPLLGFTERDIRDYLQRLGLPHYSDPSNRDRNILRNQLRHDILPPLYRRFPHMAEHIADTARILGEESDWFRAHASRILSRRLVLGKILPPDTLESLQPAEQRHVIREYLRRLRGDLMAISLFHVESLMPGICDKRHLSLPGITLSRRKGFLFPADFKSPGYKYILPARGEFPVPEINARIRLTPVKQWIDPYEDSESGCFRALVNPGILSKPLGIRVAVAGDRYRKPGNDFSQKVYEMIRAGGLPAPLRSLRPLFCDGSQKPFWLPGNPPAQHAAGLRGKPGLLIEVEGLWPLPTLYAPDS